MNAAIWTSTKNVLTAHGEDDVFKRHNLLRVRPSLVPYLSNYEWEMDLTGYTNQDVHLYMGDLFFKGLKRIMDYIVSGSDYSMRKVTIIYIPSENAIYLMGGNTFVQNCFKCEVGKKFGKLAEESFSIQISYDTLKEYVQAVVSEFRITGVSLLIKQNNNTATFACKSEDANNASETRYLMFAVDCMKDPDCDSVLEMFQQYEAGSESGYQILYRINADTRLKNIFSNRQRALQFVNRKGLLSLKMLPEGDSIYAIEAPTACPLIPMSDIGMAKEGETIASVDGKDLYEILSLEKELVYTMDIMGKMDGEKVLSPCIKIDSNNLTVLISQNIHIQFPETKGFVMKKGTKFVEADEGEALKKAAKLYTPKEMSKEERSHLEEVISQMGERISSLEQGVERLAERVKANDKALVNMVAKLNEAMKGIADLKEPAIVETPEMMETLQNLPNAKDANIAYKVKDYLLKQAGHVVKREVIIQEVPGASTNIRVYLGVCATHKRIYSLDGSTYYVPSDIGTRINGGAVNNPPFRLQDFPEDVIEKYGLKDKFNGKEKSNIPGKENVV